MASNKLIKLTKKLHKKERELDAIRNKKAKYAAKKVRRDE